MPDYNLLTRQAIALTADEPDRIANLANLSALLFEALPDVNWAGFYRVAPTPDGEHQELVLGPFQGKTACVRIPHGRGVCGQAWVTGRGLVVDDVHQFEGHIACDPESRSELVIPLLEDGEVIGVLDIDSPHPGRFTLDDGHAMRALLVASLGVQDVDVVTAPVAQAIR